MKTRTAAVLKWVRISAIVLAIAFGAYQIAAHRSLRREYDSLREAGRPMRADQIIPKDVPPGENAAPLYQAAIKMLEAESAVPLAGYAPYAGLTNVSLLTQLDNLAAKAIGNPPDAAAAGHFLRLYQNKQVVEALAIIERGTARPGHRDETDYSRGYEILLPSLGPYRRMSRILAAVARQQAANGNAEAAWRTAVTGLRFADARKNEPFLISQLSRVNNWGIASDAIRTIAMTSPPPAEYRHEIEQLLLSFESRAPLVLAADGERLLFGESIYYHSWLYRFYLPGDHAAHLHVMHEYARNMEAPYLPNDALFHKQLLDEVPRYCILTRLLIPALVSSKKSFTHMIASARITRAGLTAIRIRHETGTFPPDLQSLQLAGMQDPFTGKPLHYLATATGFSVYSVGENLIDDGGKDSKIQGTGDIVWQYDEPTGAKSTPAGGLPH